jgi:hypothetical protein
VAKGLLTGKPSVRFTVTKGKAKGAGKLKQLTIGLTDGLTFAGHKVHGHTTVAGVTLNGAKAKSLTLAGGQLVIVLSKPATAVTVTLSNKALHESSQLRSKAKHRKLSQLGVNVTVKNAAGQSSQLQIEIHKLGLPKVKAKK